MVISRRPTKRYKQLRKDKPVHWLLACLVLVIRWYSATTIFLCRIVWRGSHCEYHIVTIVHQLGFAVMTLPVLNGAVFALCFLVCNEISCDIPREYRTDYSIDDHRIQHRIRVYKGDHTHAHPCEEKYCRRYPTDYPVTFCLCHYPTNLMIA